jgi:AraC-like DNA-binding protein
MTQEEITRRLHVLRYEGKWSLLRIAKESGLSPATIKRAFLGSLSSRTQYRLSLIVLQLPAKMPLPPKKNKPGKRKRFLIRLINLKKWIREIEIRENVKLYKTRFHDTGSMTREEAGYQCCKLDYILKRYLLHVFGEELKKKKVFLGDCYAAEKWIEHISKVLPDYRRDLCKVLKKRQ